MNKVYLDPNTKYSDQYTMLAKMPEVVDAINEMQDVISNLDNRKIVYIDVPMTLDSNGGYTSATSKSLTGITTRTDVKKMIDTGQFPILRLIDTTNKRMLCMPFVDKTAESTPLRFRAVGNWRDLQSGIFSGFYLYQGSINGETSLTLSTNKIAGVTNPPTSPTGTGNYELRLAVTSGSGGTLVKTLSWVKLT